jgi:hypothetical protein
MFLFLFMLLFVVVFVVVLSLSMAREGGQAWPDPGRNT